MNDSHNVWRIGSRLEGKSEKSLLGIFRRNNIVFLEDEKHRKRFMDEVKYNDYFAISDGYKIVAVARAIGEPKSLETIELAMTDQEEERISYRTRRPYMVGVKVKIVDLKETETFEINLRWTFYKTNPTDAEKVINLYNQKDDVFEVNSFTYTLKSCSGRCLLDGRHKYVIPIYQRPYSWGEDQVVPLYHDIIDGFLGKEKPMFIGTMQLSAEKYVSAHEVWQDVIDGQQRITTISILLKELLDMLSSETECDELHFADELHFDWLETRVNAEQQNVLKHYFDQKCSTQPLTNEEQSISPCDPYARNASLIRNLIEQTFGAGEESKELKLSLVHYILEKIYFVVIETRAGLSKTLKIFDVINTTGLDLNGSDIFKIRMYEYLKDQQDKQTKEPYGEKAFDKISEIYDLLDRNNKDSIKHYQEHPSTNSVFIGDNTRIVSVGDILTLYKDVLITDYQLPSVLYDFGWDTFFDRLFDTLLGVKQWEHFTKNVELSLDVLTDIIQLYFKVRTTTFKTLEAMFAYHLIGWSRYPRYKNLVYLYSYYHRHPDGSIQEQELAHYLIALNKMFFVYSINYGKSLTKVHSFMREKAVRRGTSSNDKESGETCSIVERIGRQINSEEVKSYFRSNLEGEIFDNMRKKRLICMLSEFLEIQKQPDLSIKDAHTILFGTHFDIEHIHALNADAAHGSSDRLDGSLLNCIGNLCMLEYDINRSIQDHEFKRKLQEYAAKKSKFITIKKLIASQSEEWNREQILDRKHRVVGAIMNYIFYKI